MFVIIGLVMLFGCVFGFYILHHGPMAPIIEAAPDSSSVSTSFLSGVCHFPA